MLGLRPVGPDDSFFDLGGDSIMSMQLVALARRAGLIITARHVFENRTPAALAWLPQPAARPTGRALPLMPRYWISTRPKLAELEAAVPGLADVWPVSPLQQGLLFHAGYDKHGLDIYTEQRALDLAGPLDAARWRPPGRHCSTGIRRCAPASTGCGRARRCR